ncbi:hypothetical protein [Flavobacterium silvaticum]|uniref:Uncharacterized protein n=1 Tax=Flavobacterium silvaticum TaxID=1852020 RepID=A0A972JI68_9FLAO|nr:hypothetical protein [Flavobacterium silvaticum]NMH27868.1 hypothetical protein [Flavobacterium silvaticum]
MEQIGAMEWIIIFAVSAGPVLAGLFMAGYILGKRKGFKEAAGFPNPNKGL